MKCRILPLNESEINRFLATPGLKFVTKDVLPARETDADIISPPEPLILYTTPEDDQAAKDKAIIDQNAQMDRLLDIAREVDGDHKYGALKNNTQREMYLFAKYNVTGSDASRIGELLKPEMKAVLGRE
jgi:hypothetical protein